MVGSAASLAIDTATRRASVALSGPDGIIHEIDGAASQSHYEELTGLVDRVCAKAGVAITHLKEIVIGQGPGSFTGLRIGYGFAVGLALGLGIPVRQVSSLAGMAMGAWSDGLWHGSKADQITAVLDARRGELFVQSFGFTETSLDVQSAAPAEIISADSLKARFPTGVFVGEVETPLNLVLHPPRRMGGGVLLAAGHSPNFGYSVEGLSALQPNYLRAVAARTIAERTASPVRAGS